MLKTFRINVDGHPYTVTVEEVLDEHSLQSNMTTSLPNLVGSLPLPVMPQAIAPAPVAAPAPAAAPAAPAAAGSELAPLAGVVVAIEVKVGDAVQEGQRIAIIEAMKMKTEIFAKHSGKVTAVNVRVNDTVETGQALLAVG